MDRSRNGYGNGNGIGSFGRSNSNGNGKLPHVPTFDTSYSSVIVVRRYTCYQKTSLFRKTRLLHEGILNIYGLHPNFVSSLTQEFCSLKYKLKCNCFHCISYQEVVKSSGLVVEPLMAGVALVFNYLAGFNYTLSSNTTVQNPDRSNSTIWVWTMGTGAGAAKVHSDI